jgi:ectoine hydroxylase-related dioxygenase (phytanoyl-CoA dioxygenase family)
MTLSENRIMSIDLRTRVDSDQVSIEAAPFFRDALPDLLDDTHALIAPAAARFPLKDFCLEVDAEPWTLSWQSDRVSIRPGHSGVARARLSTEQLSDIVNDQLTPIALMSNAILDMPEGSLPDFMNWWLILRGALDARRVYVNGDLDLASDRPRSFSCDDDDEEMRLFLEEFGYLHIRNVFDAEEMAAVAVDFDVAAPHYEKGDVRAWFATTRDDEEHLVRMEGFDRYSKTTTELLQEERFQRIGRIPACGHVSARKSGQRAAALVKPIGVVKGISDLPWHKDCSLGRHSYECCSLTVGLSVTGADAESGQLRVLPGSHRALIWPAPCVQPGLDLQPLDLPTETGDVTVHLSCTQHMSQAPVARPRKVVYSGFSQAPADPEAAAANRARIDGVRGKAHTSVSQEPGYQGD